MKRVLVTGATGFIGRRLVERLRADGYTVRVLCRSPGGLAGVEVAVGDVTDAASLARAVDGVDGVFHLAALYKFGLDEAAMRRVNVEGTRNLLFAARGKRVLYCGSDTSLGDTAGQIRDERFSAASPPRSAYERTKREAHELVQGQGVINAIVSTVYGPGDQSPMGELFARFVAGQMPFILDADAGYTLAHVDDVAEALKRAYERGRPGEDYLISGTPLSFAALFSHLAAVSGLSAPRLRVPRWLSRLAWLWTALFCGFLRKRWAEARELVAMGTGVTRYFSGEKARTQLGWRPRPLDEGLRQTLAPLLAAQARRAGSALGRTRPITLGLGLFDLGLGGGALFLPTLYLALMHPRFSGGGTYLVSRTGLLWLFFAGVELFAAARPSALWVGLVGVLRLMDVPADLGYLACAHDLGGLGRAALVLSPLCNLVSGLYLLGAAAAVLRLDAAATRNRQSEHGHLVGAGAAGDLERPASVAP